MIYLSNESIGKHFVRVNENEVINSYYQYLSLHTRDWEASTCKKSENIKVSPFGCVYRKPIDFVGFCIIVPKFLKRRFGILIFNVRKFFR